MNTTDYLQGEFDENTDILHLDKYIVQVMKKNNTERLIQIDNDIKTYEKKKQGKLLTVLERKYFERQITALQKEQYRLQGNINIAEYKEATAKFIDLFKKIGGGVRKITVGSIRKKTEEEERITPYKLNIIRKYIEAAKDYVDINMYESLPLYSICSGCGYNMSTVLCDENGTQVCPQCKYEQFLPSKGYTTSSSADVQPSKSRHDNEEKENFMKARIRYEGRQKEKLPSDLYTRLDEYFITFKLPTGEDIKQGTANKDAISRDRMFQALSYIGYPLYEHVYLIMNRYIGTPLPDISHLNSVLDLHFDVTHKASQDLGLQPINTQFRLFKQLEMLGHPVHISDFRVPKTRDLLEMDQESWRRICEHTGEYGRSIGIKYIPTI